MNVLNFNISCKINCCSFPDPIKKNELIFYYLESGNGIININNKTYPLITPVCINLNEYEQLKISDQNLLFHMFSFKPDIINSSFDFKSIRNNIKSTFSYTDRLDLYWLKPFINRCPAYNGILPIGPATAEIIKNLLIKLHSQLQMKDDNFWPCKSRSYLFEILNIVLNRYNSSDFNDDITLHNIDNDIKNIISFINENYNQKITIPGLSRLFNIDRTTLSKKFLKTTGTTIINYINNLRIKMVCILLKDTMLPVYDIMYRTGFEDPTHFRRIFKKITGLSPTRYRNK